ncbi:ubinuclein-1- hypothetical protein [Limosa lapponica baueri]|uniref:Uncharacterized protein n=1 Tax=Limosa lapponica baueri TaxID=1758121 RepID=A0A2I0T2F7_LIMLA|nr:ubinuclein-1- hypothetical protein [Limosa lapponica baueri]
MADPLPSLLGQAGDNDLLEATTSMDSVTDLDQEEFLSESSEGSPIPERAEYERSNGMALEQDFQQPPSLEKACQPPVLQLPGRTAELMRPLTSFYSFSTYPEIRLKGIVWGSLSLEAPAQAILPAEPSNYINSFIKPDA